MPTCRHSGAFYEFVNLNETKIIKSLFPKMGINVHCVFTGDASYERIITAHYVKLNLIICQNTGQFFAETMQERYGVPYLKVSFLSLSQSIDSLRRIGQYFSLKKKGGGGNGLAGDNSR